MGVEMPGVDNQAIRPDQTLSQMLQDGELDAIMGPRPPSGFPGPRVRRLFEDFRSVEMDYFFRTRVFPIMHTVVIRRELLEREPWVARSLYDAFSESKKRALAELADPVVLYTSLPWQIAEVERTSPLIGEA